MIGEKVIRIMEEIFNENIDKDMDQKDCEKWDSLNHLNLIIDLESEFNISFEPEEIGTMTSVEKTIKTVEGKING